MNRQKVPVTGSSGMPFHGAKLREKKSYPGCEDGAPLIVTMTLVTLPLSSLFSRASGAGLKDVSADLQTTVSCHVHSVCLEALMSVWHSFAVYMCIMHIFWHKDSSCEALSL